MSELITLARPYARAAFGIAQSDNGLENWSSMLSLAAAVAGYGGMGSILTNPSISAEQISQSFIDVCGDQLDPKGQNFVQLLAENKRMSLLPEISALFEGLKANFEKSVDVEVTTAFEISEATADQLAKALKNRLQREIKLATSVDRALIGGAIIRAGDTVIDSSVRGKLSKLAESMNS